MTKRSYSPAEGRLLAEFTAIRWPAAQIYLRVKLGPIVRAAVSGAETPAELAAVGIWRPWCDAVIAEGGLITIVEAKIRPSPGMISQLEVYARLWPATPEFEHLRSRPLRMFALMAIDVPVIRQLAAERGIVSEVYRPPWIEDYLATLHKRASAAPQLPVPVDTQEPKR